jgi:hypothetical protein
MKQNLLTLFKYPALLTVICAGIAVLARRIARAH